MLANETVQVAPKTDVVKGKWGFYPCNYQTFLKLKELNKVAEKTKMQRGSWRRWNRKWPKNRVMRAKIRNDKGQTVGYKPPVPVPEPKVVELLSQTVPVLSLTELVSKEYFNARHPKPVAEAVQPLGISEQEINRLMDEYCN